MAARFTRPYVDALFDVAGSVRGVELLLPGLEAFAATLQRSDELRSLLRNPAVDRAKKAAIVEAVSARESIAALGSRFLKTLLTNRRLPALAEVLRAVRERLDKERRVVEASLRTAAPLDAKAQGEIQETLERRARMTVRLKTEVDAGLLAGFVVRLGSEVYDASLAHRLEKARQALHRAPAGQGAG